VLEEPVHDHGLRLGAAEPVPLFFSHDGKAHDVSLMCVLGRGRSLSPLSDTRIGLQATFTTGRAEGRLTDNLLSTVPKGAQDTVAAVVRSVFSAPDHATAMAQLHDVARMLEPRFPQAAELLEDAAEDVLAHMHSPGSTAAGCTPRTRSSACTRR
jgi:hypothetical protein